MISIYRFCHVKLYMDGKILIDYMAEVCQSGIDKYAIPQWCIEHNMDDPLFWGQFVVELFVIVVMIVLLSKVFTKIDRWKMKRRIKKEDPF